jgi:acetyl-CoA carboxylase carboxyl transferase subunit alpha
MDKMNVLEFEQSIAKLDHTIQQLEKAAARENRPDATAEIAALQAERDALFQQFFSRLDAWDEVLLSRHVERPYTLDYISRITEDFIELHGDRLFGDDGAMVGGMATIGGKPVVIIGQQKGRDLKERQKRNFGYAKPEGYRKALRLMQMAERFGHPVVTLVDTPGADSNVPSEERGIGEAIARNLREMSGLKTPIVSVIIGEGGSGGALGIAVADRVLMLEHAIYSVIAPEGCAAIIWRDPARGADAAKAMRVTAKDALALKLIDEVLPEPMGGAHRDLETTANTLREALIQHLATLQEISIKELTRQRYSRLRSMARIKE